MSDWVPLALLGLAIIIAGYVNYFAFSHIQEKASRTRNLAVWFGGIGLLLVVLAPFAPLLGFAFYFTDDGKSGAAVFAVIWIGAALFTVLSLIVSVIHAIANKTKSA